MTATDATPFPTMLRDQIRHEFTASQQYTAVAVYLDGEDLPQLAALFYAQAVEERNHAMSMVQYLLDAGHDARIPGTDDVRTDFSGVEDVVALALDQEKVVTDQITALARAARDQGDYIGEQFMGWFLKEQVEEVASMSTLLTVVRRAGANLFHVEDFVARELAKGEPVDSTAPAVAGGRLASAG